MGLNYVKSQANFILVDMGNDAKPIVEALLKKGLIVRGVQPYNLPTFIRVSIGLPSENVHFVRALRQTLQR